MKKFIINLMTIGMMVSLTLLSGCKCDCPSDLPVNYQSISEVQATALMSAYNPASDNTTTGILLEKDLLKYFCCIGYANVYAKFGMNPPPLSTLEVVFVAIKADGTREYFSAKPGTSSTGPTCPTRCP